MFDLSIAIPTLGDTKKVNRLLKSIENQQDYSSLNIEVIVVFNGLAESVYQNRIKQLVSVKNLKVIFEPSVGVNRARNRALAVANATIVYFLDDDCELTFGRTLVETIQLHQNSQQDILAFGAGYLLPSGARLFDQIYNEIQMRWLFSQMPLLYQKYNRMQYLLGGNFSIKKNLVLKYALMFNNDFTYGGTETEFFSQVSTLKLNVHHSELDVTHHTSESLLSLCRKIFKQGQGRYKIQHLHPNSLQEAIISIQKVQSNVGRFKYWQLFFNYIFWLGYYCAAHKPHLFMLHIVKNIWGNFNSTRYKILKRFE